MVTQAPQRGAAFGVASRRASAHGTGLPDPARPG